MTVFVSVILANLRILLAQTVRFKMFSVICQPYINTALKLIFPGFKFRHTGSCVL